MAIQCRNCMRVNPPEARYCYHDGVALPGQSDQAGPIAVGAQPFGYPFVFPSGRACHNFDELVMACDALWDEARELVREGSLAGFLGALGRADLAQAARRAAEAADIDQALHDLLNRFPGDTREIPRLFVHPTDINLGTISRSSDRHFALQIENQGSGLLAGTILCDETTAWLDLGEGGGTHEKRFQCRSEMTLPVHVQGKGLRAGHRPLEGRLLVESNGGSSTVLVRVQVPVQPYPDGVLAGAVTPRQVAEKARDHPREAASYFEDGSVARWYESNGWTYPVQGPTSSGLGAIQQFFEALGLVTPPKVRISETRIQLEGAPGGKLEHTLQLSTTEKRHVFAHSVSTVPWLQVGRVQLKGRTAIIPLFVGVVPSAPGERLNGKVNITANGNQKFTVEVNLKIAGRPSPFGGPGPVRDITDVLASPSQPAQRDVPPPRPVQPHVAVTDSPPPVRSSGANRPEGGHQPPAVAPEPHYRQAPPPRRSPGPADVPPAPPPALGGEPGRVPPPVRRQGGADGLPPYLQEQAPAPPGPAPYRNAPPAAPRGGASIPSEWAPADRGQRDRKAGEPAGEQSRPARQEAPFPPPVDPIPEVVPAPPPSPNPTHAWEPPPVRSPAPEPEPAIAPPSPAEYTFSPGIPDSPAFQPHGEPEPVAPAELENPRGGSASPHPPSPSQPRVDVPPGQPNFFLRLLLHLTPLGLLLFALLVVIVRDLIVSAGPDAESYDPGPSIINDEPLVTFQFHPATETGSRGGEPPPPPRPQGLRNPNSRLFLWTA